MTMLRCENHKLRGEDVCRGTAVAQVAVYTPRGEQCMIYLCNTCSSRVYRQMLEVHEFLTALFGRKV
jgi:hypothetical protein